MPIPENRLSHLFDRWVHQQATPAEHDELMALLDTPDAEAQLEPHMKEVWHKMQAKQAYTPDEKDRIVNHILDGRPGVQATPIRNINRYWWAAAAVLVLAAAGIGYFTMLTRPGTSSVAITSAPDVAPGRQGAILTLANGQTIVLDSLNNGVIANQNGTQVSLNNGQLNYDAAQAGEVLYNTITTPRGRMFQLALPDGSLVWLNAASSLRFPTAFSSKQRLVEVTGEAYFEVAQNISQPFIVKISEGMQVEVMGTRFNVNAYADEAAITTTLLDGGVNINNGGLRKTLKPGQQASVKGNDVKISNDVDTDLAVAWKNGFISFQGAGLQDVMRKVARWYDLQVVYEGKIPETEFDGDLPKNLKLSQVIKILTKVEVKFRIEEGNKLIVLPE
ncbi:FecR family protein [uncultured Chitinophaga sp.]|uniref:FecR family protein n=1 Tax=uncultured Chitinophaga sp. TaxID=339340 RepID=UPI0025F5A07D|nr:FecR family protein [uncultured Chitinophaga sp.]